MSFEKRTPLCYNALIDEKSLSLTQGFLMKKLAAILLSCFLPFLAFANSSDGDRPIETFQERCAKEQDPIKRHNYCNLLDKYGQSEAQLTELVQETVLV